MRAGERRVGGDRIKRLREPDAVCAGGEYGLNETAYGFVAIAQQSS